MEGRRMMGKMNRQKIAVFIIIIAIMILLGALIMCVEPKTEEQIVVINNELNEEAMIALLKQVPTCLTSSETLSEGVITSADMANFSVAYMELSDKYSKYITYVEGEELCLVDMKYVSEIAEYIFGVSALDFESTGYEIVGSDIYIPINTQGGDMEIYKYRKTEYDQNTNVYIAYIDSLEILDEDNNNLMDANQLEYSEEDVVYTLVLKYKLVDGRKILLAYNAIVNTY